MLSFRTQRIQTVTRYIKTHIQNDPDFGSCLLITHLNLIFPLAFPFVSRPPKRPISFLLIVRIPNRPLVVRRRVTVNPVGTTGVILSSAQRRKRRRKKRLEVIPWRGEGQPYRINGGRCTYSHLHPPLPPPGRAPEASPWFVYILWKFGRDANGGGGITCGVLDLSRERFDFLSLFIYFLGGGNVLRC